MQNDTIIITESAKTQIKKLCNQHSKHVRFKIDSGGCQGFTKVWDLDDTINEDDSLFSFENSILLIDNSSLELLGQSVVIDYKSGFDGSYFTVDIPSSTSNCGCGNSFNV